MALLAGRREAGVRHRTFRIVVIGLVATVTVSRKRGVVVVDVAVGACPRWYCVRSSQRERRVVVVEGRIGPLHRVVAEFAGGWKARVRHRTFRIVEISLMACDAECAIQTVVIVNVAIRASPWRDCVGTSQREAGL